MFVYGLTLLGACGSSIENKIGRDISVEQHQTTTAVLTTPRMLDKFHGDHVEKVRVDDYLEGALYEIKDMKNAVIMFEPFAGMYEYINQYTVVTSVKLSQFGEEMRFIERLESTIYELEKRRKKVSCKPKSAVANRELCASYAIQE